MCFLAAEFILLMSSVFICSEKVVKLEKQIEWETFDCFFFLSQWSLVTYIIIYYNEVAIQINSTRMKVPSHLLSGLVNKSLKSMNWIARPAK